ncbi:MAG TPA: nucleotide sugar dehydrogenase [Actinomycetota bacterium]
MATELGRPSQGLGAPLRDALASHTATVAIVGLGYVGLPLLVAASREGFPAIGYDEDRGRVGQLSAGRSYVSDVADEDIAGLTNARFTWDPSELRRARVIVISVPTPLTDGVPDLTMVRLASANVARELQPETLVVLESTTYPGTTEEVVRPILETSGLSCGRDFFLGYSPERIDPGNGWSFRDTPKIVSGVGPEAGDLCELFYAQLVDHTHRAPSPREAEMAKLVENTFRHVNIALVNELATLAPELGVDIWAALDAAATKPFGYMPFWPGPGVGGHCIAIDPSYLSFRVGQRMGFGMGFVEHAKEVNNRMPAHVASRIADVLNAAGKPVNGSRVMVLGVAYKSGVNDVRESPSTLVMERLARAGADCSFHDPFVPVARVAEAELRCQPLSPELLETQDCVAILTAHPAIDYEWVVRHAPLVFDARGVTRGLDASNVVLL